MIALAGVVYGIFAALALLGAVAFGMRLERYLRRRREMRRLYGAHLSLALTDVCKQSNPIKGGR